MQDHSDLEETRRCFLLFDKRGDMKIEPQSVIDVLRSLGLNPISDDVEKCLKASDLLHQRIDFETFYAIFEEMSKRPAIGSFDDIVEGLRTLDRDQTGMVSAAELRHLLVNIADKMSEQQAEDIISQHEDSHASVAYEEMVKTVLSG